MKKRQFLKSAALLSGSSLAWFSLGTKAVNAGARGLVLVVGKNSSVNDVSKADLRRLFSGDPVTVSGQALVPFSLAANSPDRQAFDKVVLGLTPEAATKYWIDRRIRGQGAPPKSAPTPDVLLKVVANFPGAIGYVPAEQVNATVKVVAIDGKPPEQQNYLLAEAK